MSVNFDKLESYVNSLAENIKQLFEQLAGARVLSTKIKVEERIRANYALAVLVGYEHQEDRVKGNVILGFEDQRMAEIVAGAISAKLEAPSEDAPEDEAGDVLAKFMNNIVDLTTSKWEAQGFKVQFGEPQTMRNALIQNISGLASRAFLIVFLLGVDHIVFRVTFNETIRENTVSSEPQKILVVDDSKLIRNIMTEVLEKVGFEVTQAQNGVEAIALWESFKPAVTIMDLNMPELGGMDAIKAIREKDAQARFIILTSSARRDEVLTAKTLGVSSYLLKPFQPKQLLDTLKKVLTQETK